MSTNVDCLAAPTGSNVAFSLRGKTALVTGGGSGIGAAIAREFARAGARVIVADICLEAAEEVAATLEGGSSIQMDVSSAQSIANSFVTIDQLDILVNNAGIGLVGNIAETSMEEFARILQVNATSVFVVTQVALPLLLRSHGSVVNIASVAGLVGIPRRFAYTASKGAVIAMSRQLAVDYPRELRVNCVCPGTIDSPFVAGYLARYHTGDEVRMREELKARQPVGRLGRPEEVASLVRYLCSSEAEFMHGSVLTLDGGWTAA